MWVSKGVSEMTHLMPTHFLRQFATFLILKYSFFYLKIVIFAAFKEIVNKPYTYE